MLCRACLWNFGWIIERMSESNQFEGVEARVRAAHHFEKTRGLESDGGDGIAEQRSNGSDPFFAGRLGGLNGFALGHLGKL